MSENGQEPSNSQGVVDTATHISCSACGSALDVTAKFCPECGVQRTSVPVPQLAPGTPTEAPSDPTDATRTTGEFEMPPVATPSLPLAEETSLGGAHTELLAEQEMAAEPAAGEVDDVAPDRPWYRRTWVWIAVGVAVVATALVVGVVSFNAMARRPVVAALTEAASQFDGAVAAVAEARTLDDLTEITEELPGWIRPIEGASNRLQSARGTALRDAADEALAAEVAYLSALRPLSDLQSDDLSDWPEISEELAAASAGLAAAHEDLTALDAAAGADAAVDPAPATVAVELVIAVTTADNATAAVESVVSDLRSATDLEGIQQGGSAAALASAELQGALQTLDDLADAEATQERLSLQAGFLDEAATLESLTVDRLDAWAAISVTLAQRGDAMVVGMDASPAERSSLTGELRQMRSSIDEVVTSAQRKLAQWRRSVRRAENQRDAELAALSEYERGYRVQMGRYDDLRDQTADFTERIRSESGVTYSEAYDAFYDGISQREEVRDAMGALSPPDDVRSSHLAVVRVIDDAIAAMQAAVDGVSESQFCYFCYYEDTSGWRRFQAESDRITDEFASATSAWDSAVASQRSALENLKLPKKPNV